MVVTNTSRTKSDHRNKPKCRPAICLSILLLVLLGVSVVHHESRLATFLRQETTSHTSTAVSDGWHPIHVFYGDREALLEGVSPNNNKTWFSQVGQDQLVVGLLGEEDDNGRSRYFIDLAANDATDMSNTLGLEKRGWNGLCIEPNPVYWYRLSHRKCTVVGALVGGNVVEQVNASFRGFFGGIDGLMMNKKQLQRARAPQAVMEKRYTAPLVQVFQKFNVPHVVDYMSLDVEGAEYLIMKEFPLDTYVIRFMTVERPSEELKSLLTRHGYVYLKTLSYWGETLWAHNSTGFTPDHPRVVSLINRTLGL